MSDRVLQDHADRGRRRLVRAVAALVAAAAGVAERRAHAQQDGAEPQTIDVPTQPAAPIFNPAAPWEPGGAAPPSPTPQPGPSPTPQPGPSPTPQPGPSPTPQPGPSPSPAPAASPPTEDLPAWAKPREAWAAAAPVQPYVPHTPTTVSLHHTGTAWYGRPGPEQTLRNIQAFHTGREREWEDIAYHFLVDLDGTVWNGRPPTVRGNPSVYYDSMGYVLICFLGDYTVQDPSEAQLAAAANTAAWLTRRFELGDRITGHRDHAPTSCPGDNVYRLLRAGTFARRVRDQLT